MNKEKSLIILKGTSNYILWFDSITTEFQKEQVSEYAKENKIKDIDVDDLKKKEDLEHLMKNATARSLILHSITPEIHKKVAGILSAKDIMDKLKKYFGGDKNDTSYWISRLNSLSTSKEEKIMETLDQMRDIFKVMDSSQLRISDEEKIKYLYNALPEDYMGKFILEQNETFDSLYNKIDADLKKRSYIKGWNYDNRDDDPMEINQVRKIAIKNKNNYKNNKYCSICEKTNHSTKECWYNLKNKNSKFTQMLNKCSNDKNNNYFNKNKNNKNKNNCSKNYKNNNKKEYKFAGNISKHDINNYYNSNVDFEDIKFMFLEDKQEFNNNNKKFKKLHVFQNKNINKDKYFKSYINYVCSFKNSGVLLMNKYNKSSWLYDSGAGEHLTNDKSLLINYKEEKCILKCANNSSCVFEGYGEFHFFINSHKIILKRVLYSKEVSRNIISGIELAKIDIKALTERSDNRVKLTLMDNNNNTIGTFHSNNNNEILITAIHNDKTKQNIKNYIFNINKLNHDSKLIWHRRLGHYYIENIDDYLNLHNIKEPFCTDCRISKMKRKPHNKEMPKASNILEVIHSDIIGPINDSINGMRFIITFIDEKTHKSWIFLMKRKSEAIDIIIKFLKYLNNLFNDKKVKIFKSDNAREYKNKRIISFCEDNGIAKIYSPPYNPENNGIAERFNQTLISCTKTLLSWSKHSENFWDYAITYGNYLYNKTPHQISNNNIPDECFYNRKVKLDNLRTFGCIAYYKIYDQNKGKFHSNSNKGIFPGFDEKTYSYLIMDFNNYNLHSVREIFCIEDEPANISLSNSAVDKNEYPTFLKFDFNFSKYSTINKDFYFPNNNGNNSDINKNNSKNNENNSENNKKFLTLHL